MTPEDVRTMQLWYTLVFLGTSVSLALLSVWMYKIGWDKGFEAGHTSASKRKKKAATDQEAILEARMHADMMAMDAKAMLMAADIPDDGLNLSSSDFVLTPLEDKGDSDDYFIPLAPDDDDPRFA